jgi:heat shock protein HslJ
MRAAGTALLAVLFAGALAAGAHAQGEPPAGIAPVLAALTSHNWSLEAAADAGGARIDALFADPRKPYTLRFSDTRVTVGGGCNLQGAGYDVSAERRLHVGRLATTLMACDPALMRGDALFADFLAQPVKLDVVDGTPTRLRLAADDGATLIFSGELTPEARYGAPAVVFLEIAAARKPCRNPLTLETTCLQARERHYDAAGLTVGAPGPFESFYPHIDGFTHVEGQRNVLRVKRFARSGAPPLYVLDLVVESEITKTP